MLCPECDHDTTFVTNTRRRLKYQYRRRRECDLCGHRWTTIEKVVGLKEEDSRIKSAIQTEFERVVRRTLGKLAHEGKIEVNL